jgi:hypothetical protein
MQSLPAPNSSAAQPRWMLVAQVATVLLFIVALWVRGITAVKPLPPEERPDVVLTINEPMQFLTAGAHLRIDEGDEVIREASLAEWRVVRDAVFALEGCPDFSEWIATEDGQACERLLATLRRGTPEEALAGLALLFELARRTDWETGAFAGSQNAEQIANHLAEWLRLRGDASVEDPTLHEPAMAAMVLYSRAMRFAYRAPMFGVKDSALERAREFIRELTGAPNDRHTDFGVALQSRFARAMGQVSNEDDPLLGFEEDAQVLFPDLDGVCE